MSKQVVEACAQLRIDELISRGARPDYVEHAGQRITVGYTRTNGAGRRPWWLCPRCGRRCGALYLPPGLSLLACRLCYGLVYASQQEDSARRRRRRARAWAEMQAYEQPAAPYPGYPELPPPLASPTPSPRRRGRPRTKRRYTRRRPATD